MYRGKSVAAVVPSYNEETQIGKVIETMPAFVDHIVIVNDASRDRTAAVVEEYQKHDGRVVLINHEVNQGVGGAIATGYKWARDRGADVAVVMAGDGQMAPEDLPNLLDPVVSGEVDYSKGNRLFTGEAFKEIPKVRYFGNAALSFLTKIASGYWHIADSQTGYTAISKKALQTIDWDQMYKRYGQPNDLLVRLNLYRFKVRDVPVKPVYNVGEISRLKVRKVLFTISWLLVKLFLWRMKEKYIVRDFHPLIFFYMLGFVLFGLSGVLFIRLIYLWITLGFAPELTAIAWMFSFGLGLQCLFFAMWFDMEYNKDLK
ncbi:MAG: glycosyltransferase family 2 protein [Syntrophaceae bacterium]|nr:glycosyltransferase family 2 protein [Syntrophaceae bacterium]